MSHPEDNIGREWDSRGGRRRVLGVHPRGAYVVQTENSRFPELVPFAELEETISFDERAAESRRRSEATAEEEKRRQQSEKVAAEFTYGFAEQFSPPRRQHIIETLNAQVRHAGEFISRKELIVTKVREGWTVQDNRLVSPDGNKFFFQKDLTKTGLEFARYLQSSPKQKKLKRKLLR